MTARKKAETSAPASNTDASVAATEEQPVEALELSSEGFDVTQPPPEDDKQVDYSKTTMPVINDPRQPADFDPQSNR